MAAYLFVHFVGTEFDESNEQIYFSVSKDGSRWTTLNGGAPILSSELGEKGVRDPHIIRSPKGDYFYIVATDLSIYHRRNDPDYWKNCQTKGSRSIVIWESSDLVHWSDTRMAEVAAPDAGCAWAPETIYDDEKDMYMIFWASRVGSDNFSKQRIYRCYTKDFVSFTPAEVYIDNEKDSIDTTFIKEGGVYYRFTKNESKSSVVMEQCTSLNGTFTPVAEYKINGVAGDTVTGYEGPTAYRMNGEDRWYLLLDHYSKKEGYKPFITEDIAKGEFVAAPDFVFDGTYRHGTVMPITDEEYERLVDAF